MSRRRRDHMLLASEACLALLTIAAVVGMHRLFADGTYRGPLVFQAIVAHTLVALLRRAGVRIVPAALACIGLAALFITWARFPETTRWLLPTGSTLDAVGDDLRGAWRTFGDVRAPAPVHNGFLAVSSAAIWAIVFVADWAAFRVWATFEALLPATTLFVFSAALGGPGSPFAGAALFAGSALLFVLVHRTANQERTSRWAGDHHRNHGRSSLIATGAALTGLAVVVGTAAGPRLPGAGAEALVAWRDLTKDEPTREVNSPMVDLNPRLVEQSEAQVFTVVSEEASYWRLTSLDEFDGQRWRSSYGTEDADGELDQDIPPEAETRAVTQSFTITGLSSVWLPAAFDPVEVHSLGASADEQKIDWDKESSTLMVDRDVKTSNNFTYEVTSVLPLWTAAELRSASPGIPDEIRGRNMDLPDSFPDAAGDWADQVTRGADTAYDKAIALQNEMQTWTYDQTVEPGHSNDALLRFLDTRRGYCEQFAAAFAALARHLGIPSRVAVGFSPGQRDPFDPTLFTVKGVHAHAWPELYIGEYGWVPFEPTPTRGPPRGESWLGIPEAQDTTGGGTGAADPGAGPDGTGATGDIGPSGDEQRESEGLTVDGGGGDGAQAEDDPFLPASLRVFGIALGVALLAYGVLVPGALAVRQGLRRRRASTPAGRVRYWWRDIAERAAAAGIALAPSLTIAESADRLAAGLPGTAPQIQDMARTMERIAYAELPVSEDEANRTHGDWARVTAEARRRVSLPRRLAAWFDARRLLPAPSGRLVAHQGPA
jgi:transglutaminase-like putative cysteine protease